MHATFPINFLILSLKSFSLITLLCFFFFLNDCSFYLENPLPTEDQRYELGQRLNMEPKQVKFWFQNKRNQMKVPKKYKNVNMWLCLFLLFAPYYGPCFCPILNKYIVYHLSLILKNLL